MAGAMGGAEGSRGAASGFAGVNGALVSRMKRSRSPAENVEGEREEKVALGLRLGLSTNGRFGVDPAMKQTKSSSPVSNMVFNVVSAGNGGNHRAIAPHAPLMRSCSAPPGARMWLSPERPVSAGRLGLEKLRKVDGLHGKEKRRSLKGAIESRGLQTDLVKGATQTATTGSSSRHPLPNKASVKEEPTGTVANAGATSNIPVANAGATSNIPVKNAPFNRPYVSTRAHGPNHKKISGFLYKYDKAEDVKIVCNCHGTFHSPAEFVKHGGGSEDDIAYPLKRILVSPFPFC